MSKSAAHILPSASPDEMIELVLEEHEGAEHVALRQCTWTEGLGWCGQKTIRLDADQLDELHRALTAARQRVMRRRAEQGRPVEHARVIKLPTLN